MAQHPSGFLLIDKPADITSHDVIDRLRRTTGIKKIGHAGTLDPFATGLLIVAVGRQATKRLSTFVGLDKIYETEIVLGATTESLDPETPVQKDTYPPNVEDEAITSIMESLTGPIRQIPPMHSAVKKDGKKLYELAREGKTVKREPRPVSVYGFSLTEALVREDDLIILQTHIHCSSGTYVRALARDLGDALHVGAYVRRLHRTQIGDFSVKYAVGLDEITPENWTDHLQSVGENFSNTGEFN